MKVTNPERAIDPSTGITKLELVGYCESIADPMLSHLKMRPLSLLRAPNGVAKSISQKRSDTAMPGLTELDPNLWPGHSALLVANSTDAICQTYDIVKSFSRAVAQHLSPPRFLIDSPRDQAQQIAWEGFSWTTCATAMRRRQLPDSPLDRDRGSASLKRRGGH